MMRLLVVLRLWGGRLSVHLRVTAVPWLTPLTLLLLLELHHLRELAGMHVWGCLAQSSEHGLLLVGEGLLLLVHHLRELGVVVKARLRVAGRAAVLLGEVAGRSRGRLRRDRPERVGRERGGLHRPSEGAETEGEWAEEDESDGWERVCQQQGGAAVST